MISDKLMEPDPLSSKVTPKILVVPLLGFSPTCLRRIGYGGGFYDRTISELRKGQKSKSRTLLTIGVAFDAMQTYSSVFESTDEWLDLIITEKRVYYRNHHT